MEIAIIILLAILLVAVLILLVFVFKKPKGTSSISGEDLKQIGSLENQISNLKDTTKQIVESSMKDVALKLSEQNSKLSETNNEKLERFQLGINKTMEERFDALNKQVDTKLSEINKKVEEKLAEGYKDTGKSLTELQERLQKIDDAQKNLQSLSSDVVSLKNVLEGNQTRGKYGEYQLSSILHNVFGDTNGLYEEQYTIKESKNGEVVRADAIVYTKGPSEFLCIDSKFPFADYTKMYDKETDEEKEHAKKEFAAAVKKHITDIKNKYIIEGKTAPQAIMFIPNDGVFAFIHHELYDIVDYARQCDVIITSPSTLQAILATIHMLRINFERSQRIDEVSKELVKLSKQFELFATDWGKFSRNLQLAYQNSEKLDTRVNKISNNFSRIKDNDLAIDYDGEDDSDI